MALALFLCGVAQADPYFWNPSTALLNGSAEAGVSANWSDSANGGGIWPASGFDDDFTSDVLNSNWKLRDADNDPVTGMASLTAAGNADQLTLTGRGKDLWLETNQYMAVYREDIKGDFDVSVDIVSLTTTDSWAKAGIMMANDYLDFTKGGCFAVIVSATAGVKVQFDSMGVVGEHDFPEGNGVAGAAPLSLRAARKGGVFYGYWRKKKTDPWILLRTGVPAGAKAANSQIGLFMTSHNVSNTGTAVFDKFQAGGPVLANNMDMVFKGTTATANANALLNRSMSAQTLDMAGYTGTFAFGASTLTVAGVKADFGSTASIDAGTGSLAFTAGAGVTQVFSPAKAGSVFPAIAKSGDGTVQIAGRPLNAGILTMTAGLFDLGSGTQEFKGLNATGGGFAALRAADTLILTGDADFSGVTAMPSAGNVQIRSESSPAGAKNVLFTPGAATFTNVYLWAIGAADFPARITVAPGTLRAGGNLILRDELLGTDIRGALDFQTHNVNVSVEGSIQRTANGSVGSPSQQLLMGSGAWTCKGNVSLSFQNSGSADLSTLDLTGASPAVQTLTIANGPLAQVKHSGTGTLNLGSALNGSGFTQTAGTLNFDGNNVNVTGNISVTNGGTTTFIGLGGRTLTADGTVTLEGKAGSLLNLNPGANWTVFGGGGVSADFASIAKSAVTSAPDGNATSACKNQGGNTHWIFTLPTTPSIVTQPGEATVLTGETAEFSVVAEGVAPLTYEWRKRGDTATLQRTAILTFKPAASDSGSAYYCTVRNPSGFATTVDAKLHVNDPAHIEVQPKNLTVLAGNAAIFSLSAKGSGKLAFVWKKKGDTAAVPGDSVLTLKAVTASLNGSIWLCVVSNAFGSATSVEVVLTVNSVPTITKQPKDIEVAPGQTAGFYVTASSKDSISYQWYRKGDTAKLSHDTMQIVSTSPGDDSARYYCVVSNRHGSVKTYEAKLSFKFCESAFTVPPGFTVPEGKPVVLAGKTACAAEAFWSEVSGPVPKLLDPQGDTLIFTAPRVKGDSTLVLQFNARFGIAWSVKTVTVKVKDTIPDPTVVFAAQKEWNGQTPRVLRPNISNAAALKAFPAYPLNFAWTLHPLISDSAYAGDSLTLQDPFESGNMEVTVCVDNGGEPTCAKTDLAVNRFAVGLLDNRRRSGPILLSGNRLEWNAPGRVRILDLSGRVLWKGAREKGGSARVSGNVSRALAGHKAFLEFLP